jgi:hypothetical protein
VPACCGREHRTAYCPSCGARMAVPSPLEGLLAHCRKQARYAGRGVLRWEEAARDTPPSALHDCQQTNAARDRARLARWQSWADGLAALLAPPGEGG